MKNKFANGDRISFYHLQPIPRKDMKTSWIDDRPLSIYGWKRITGEVRQSHASHNRLWVKCDDRFLSARKNFYGKNSGEDVSPARTVIWDQRPRFYSRGNEGRFGIDGSESFLDSEQEQYFI